MKPSLLIIPILVSLAQGQNDWYQYFYQNFGHTVDARLFQYPNEAPQRFSQLQPGPGKTVYFA